MDDKIKSALNPKGKVHDALLTKVKNLVTLSRDYMNQFYVGWENADWVLNLNRVADEADHKAVRRGEPPKQVLPFTYAQCQTFIAFFMTLFQQRDKFYELPDEPDDADRSEEDVTETLLARDLSKSKWSRVLYQCFLDLARSGFCAVKSIWHEEQVTGVAAPVAPAVPESDLFGNNLPPNTEATTKSTFQKQYNQVMSVSPFKFFPDVRFPLSRFQEGEFCASEDEYSIIRLKQMEADGMIANVSEIPELKPDALEHRRTMGFSFKENVNPLSIGAGGKGHGIAIVTEVQVWLVPSDFKDETSDTPLGKSERPELYVIWYANDEVILKAEPLNYPHNQFTYDVGEFSADQVRVVNESLAEMTFPLQEVATWFLNSRVTSVRKNIDNKLVVDPTGIEIQDLIDRKPVIRLKPGMGRSGVDTFIKQLELTDVTQGHVQDIQTLWQFMQVCTGINDNALGQYNGGRRSATEARTVNSGAAARLKTIALVVWETMFVPLGEKLVANHQKNLVIEEFARVLDLDVNASETAQAFTEFQQERTDFQPFDGTAPSEKGYIAQAMQELLLGLMSNPQTAMLLQVEPFRSMVKEIADLRGIRSPERFLPPPQQQPTNITQLPNGQPTPTSAVAGGAPPGLPAATQ